ncbi:MAG: GTPase domain-containing protein [Pirellulales bacterium]
MKHLKTWWLVVFGLLALPYLLMVAAGTLWLYEHGLLLIWLAAWGLLMVAGWPLVRWLRAKSLPPAIATVRPAAHWPPSGHQVWPRIEALARKVQDEDVPLDNIEALWNVVWRVLDTVARHYHPHSHQPALEIPVPYVLRLIELVAADLGRAFSDYVPGAHILSIHDMQRLQRLANRGRQLYVLYRLAYWGVNPVSALLAEMRNMAAGKLETASASEVKRWVVGYCVRRAGYYAIELYSGNLVLDEVAWDAYRTERSVRDTRRAAEWSESLAEEPLRILVLGQVKAGKSSLINALFGETRAAVDVVPRTRFVEPYVLDREGVGRATILDTSGYEENAAPGGEFGPLRDEVLQCDLVLLVVSARSAAREADRKLLDGLRTFFQRQPDRLMPPLVVVLTHIDQVRPFKEWDPPYDLVNPAGPKAQQIADAVRAVAGDLQVPADEIVPVALLPGGAYNVDEALAGVILRSLPEAQRVKYLRCLRQFHAADHWQRLWQQAVNSGRLLLKAGASWAGQAAGRKP